MQRSNSSRRIRRWDNNNNNNVTTSDEEEVGHLGDNDHHTRSSGGGGGCCCEEELQGSSAVTTTGNGKSSRGRSSSTNTGILCTASSSNGGNDNNDDEEKGSNFWPHWRSNRSATVATDFPISVNGSTASTSTTISPRRKTRVGSVRRRTSMPSELEDPDDMTIGIDPEEYEEEDYYEEEAEGPSSAAPITIPVTTTGGDIEKLKSISKFSTLPKELRNLIAGGIAGMVAKSVVAPLDRIKILYQVSFIYVVIILIRLHYLVVEGLQTPGARKKGRGYGWPGCQCL